MNDSAALSITWSHVQYSEGMWVDPVLLGYDILEGRCAPCASQISETTKPVIQRHIPDRIPNPYFRVLTVIPTYPEFTKV
jgi:hypothetical protein